MEDVLRLAPDWTEQNHSRISQIASGKTFKRNLASYRKRVSDECARYRPFIELANGIIDKLDRSANLSFCRNDPIVVRGSSGDRKPDVVCVHRESVYVPERDPVDNLMKEGPKEVPFWCTEILMFVEFKLTRKDLSEDQNVPKKDRSLSESHSWTF